MWKYIKKLKLGSLVLLDDETTSLQSIIVDERNQHDVVEHDASTDKFVT